MKDCKYNPLKIGDLIAKIPVLQGGMGVGVSLGGLAGAVAKEGGVGIISTAQIGFKEDDFIKNPMEANLRAMEKEFKKAKEISEGGIVGFNIMVALKQYEEQVKAAVKMGADLIVSGAGLATDLPSLVEGGKTMIAPIVSSAKSASVLLRLWDRRFHCTADMIVIEGPLAGGHLGFNKDEIDAYKSEKNYADEVKEIVSVVRSFEDKFAKKIPIVLAGGITKAEDVYKSIIELGMDGVQIATRFVTTKECDADERYKEAYINAKKEDVIIVKSPVGMPGRAINNDFMKKVMNGENFPPERCLLCLRKCDPKNIPYCITERLVNAAVGKVDEALLFCGANAYEEEKITTVHEVMAELFA